MNRTISLYVDEISPDKIKATVSTSSSIAYNLRVMLAMMGPFFAHSYRGPMEGFLGEEISGIRIAPIGKFICMLAKNDGNSQMIFLDLIDKEILVNGMAKKLSHVGLEERFMQAYAEIVKHPEKHKFFELVVGQASAN